MTNPVSKEVYGLRWSTGFHTQVYRWVQAHLFLKHVCALVFGLHMSVWGCQIQV